MSTPTTTRRRRRSRTSRRRRRRVWTAGVAAAVVVIGGVTAVVVTGDGERAGDTDQPGPVAATDLSDLEAPPPTKQQTSPAATPPAPSSALPTPDGSDVLVIEVTSTRATKATLSYTDPLGSGFEVDSVEKAPLPWRQHWTGVDRLAEGWTAHAQQRGRGQLSCTVTLGGIVIASATASGPDAAVLCTR